MCSRIELYDDSFHNIFLNGDWNLKKLTDYFGDPRTILIHVLKRKSCSVSIVNLLIKHGADVNCQDEVGCSPLMIALKFTNNEVVIRKLLEGGAGVNQVDSCGRTPLLIYLQRKDCSVGIVEVLLDSEADVNRIDINGEAPLAAAIRNVEDDGVIRVLVEKGAEVNDLKNLHKTPLLLLLGRGKNCLADTVRLLLAKGANINCEDEEGYSPLEAALLSWLDEAVIQALLEYGAKVNRICRKNKTPLLLYLDYCHFAEGCNINIVELLLRYKADVNAKNTSGYSPLMIALKNTNNETLIRVLLEGGADVRNVDSCNRTPLLIYLQKEDCSVSIVEVLLDFKANINCLDKYDESPLAAAIRNVKDEAVIRVLVERGAEVNDSKNLNATPLILLLRRRKNCSVDTVKLLLAKGANINCIDQFGYSPLVYAIDKHRDAVIQALLKNGADGNIVSSFGKTPLTLYLGNCHCSADIVKLFLRYKTEVNTTNGSDDSPLTTALKNEKSETIIRILLEGGADIHIRDRSNKSPLCIAFRHSSNNIVKLLLDAGASRNACKYHISILHCATDFAYSGLREDILKLLLETNVDVNTIDVYGQSALCYALQHGAKSHDIQLLLNEGASLNACRRHSLPLICATDGRKGTPLREDVVQLLLDNGATVNDQGLKILQGALGCCKYETGAILLLLDLPGMDAFIVANESDESLLHLAVQNPNCRPDAVKLLVNRRARVQAENQSGETPLHCAVRNELCDPSVISLLLQNNSPANSKNKSNETPLTVAVKHKCHANIVKELLIAGAQIGKAKFFHFGVKFKLLEFLAREYQMCRDPDRIDSYRMLVKFFFLQNPQCDIEDLQRASIEMYENKCVTEYGIDALSDYVNECLIELRQMDLIEVADGHSFREFVAGNLDDENYDLDQILKFLMKMKMFLDIIFLSFPKFFDIIFARVKLFIMRQKYCPNLLSVGRVNLHSVILRKIAAFLSDDDFLRFILALYKPGETFLGKRNSEQSTKPSKYPKRYP